MEALGSSEVLPQSINGMCCDMCTKENAPTMLQLIMPQQSKRYCRPRAIRRVSDITRKRLMDCLLQEREAIMSSKIGYRMLGKEVVLPSNCLKVMCKKANYVQTVNDIRVPGLREPFANRLFNVMMDILK